MCIINNFDIITSTTYFKKIYFFSLNWILYEDSDILVVNKPSGLLSVPGRGIEKSHSLYTLLCQYYKDEVFIVVHSVFNFRKEKLKNTTKPFA